MTKKSMLLVTLLILLSTSLVAIEKVNAAETIYIRANGSIEGTSTIATADNITYTFTGNIEGTITVERDNIVLDGAGYTINAAAGAVAGIKLKNRNNVTIKNVKVNAFQNGIELWYSQGITVSENEIRDCHPNHGIYSYSTTNSIITRNTIENNTGNGIHLSSNSNGYVIAQNNIVENNEGIYLLGGSSNCTISKNTITGNHGDGIHDSGAGNNTISENIVTSNDAYGIRLASSSNNNIEGNTVTNSNSAGIGFWDSSSNNSIAKNVLTSNRIGVYMYTFNNNHNSVTGNTINNNSEDGIHLTQNNDFNTIIGNSIISNGGHGIQLIYSSDTTITENKITGSGDYGIRLFDTSNSMIHHNTFDNAKQAIVQGSDSQANSWDNGAEGNFWSDYQTKYPSAKEIADTGTWDTPYVIDDKNKDNYPLMGDATPTPPPNQTLAPSFSPRGDSYSSPQNVALSCATPGATVRYTVDGSEPSSSSSAYTGPILVSVTTTIRAKAFMSGMTDSDTSSATYTISANTSPQEPSFGNAMVYAAIAIVAVVAVLVGVLLYWRRKKKSSVHAQS